MRIQVLALASLAHAAVLATAGHESVSPVAKVVELLQAMEAKLSKEGEEETKLYEEFVQWTMREQSDTRATIREQKQTVEDAKAFLSDQEAFRDKLGSEIEDVIADISRVENELKNATEIRAKERSEFEKADKERAVALRQVGLAIEVMEKSGSSFLQQNVVQRLKESALVQARSTEVALLLSRAEGKDEVIDLLHNIQDETSSNRDAGLEEEQKAQNAFELTEESLKSELQSANDLKTSKDREVSASQESSARKQNELDTAQKVLGEVEKHLADLKVEFSQKTAEQKESVALRSDELTAIQEALTILTSERAMAVFGSELAIGAPKLAKLELPGPVKLPVSLVQVTAAEHGPFDKVKGMVQDMLTKLQKEHAEAADHHAFCQEEMGKTQKSMKTKEKEVKKLSGRLEARQAAISEMTTRLEEIQKETADMATAIADATKLRTEEETQSARAISEYGDAVTILTSAMNVLKEVFAEKATAGNTIIGILEVAQSDFRKLLLEAQTQESAAAADFKKMKSEAKVRQAALKQEMESVTRMNLETQSDEQHLSRELDSVKSEVVAVQDYWEQLKPQCEVKTPSHEERAERRANEIDGLKNALGVLSGEEIA